MTKTGLILALASALGRCQGETLGNPILIRSAQHHLVHEVRDVHEIFIHAQFLHGTLELAALVDQVEDLLRPFAVVGQVLAVDQDELWTDFQGVRDPAAFDDTPGSGQVVASDYDVFL